jgi:hypothetical protein
MPGMERAEVTRSITQARASVNDRVGTDAILPPAAVAPHDTLSMMALRLLPFLLIGSAQTQESFRATGIMAHLENGRRLERIGNQ